MIASIQWAREQKIPLFGICLGMQMSVVEHARHLAGMSGAHSSELDENTPYPVIDLMPEQRDVDKMGATMRLGAYPCRVLGRTPEPTRPIRKRSSTSATATATSSTTTTGRP